MPDETFSAYINRIPRADFDVILSEMNRVRDEEYARGVAAGNQQSLENSKLAHHWMVKHDKLLGFIQKRPAMLAQLIEETND